MVRLIFTSCFTFFHLITFLFSQTSQGSQSNIRDISNQTNASTEISPLNKSERVSLHVEGIKSPDKSSINKTQQILTSSSNSNNVRSIEKKIYKKPISNSSNASLVPRNKLEKKIAYLYQKARGIKIDETQVEKLTDKKKEKILDSVNIIADLDRITRSILDEFYKDFSSEEVRSFQKNFMNILFNTASKKSKKFNTNQIFYFVDIPWEKKTQIAVLETKIPGKRTPINFIFEFDEQGKQLLDIYSNGKSSVEYYQKQFTRYIKQRGKIRLLSIMEKRAEPVNRNNEITQKSHEKLRGKDRLKNKDKVNKKISNRRAERRKKRKNKSQENNLNNTQNTTEYTIKEKSTTQ